MIRQQGWSRFEWLIAVSVIGIVLLFAVVRYLDMAREGRRMGFELLAHHFTAGVALARASWLINRVNPEQFFVQIDGQFIYMSDQGWPMSTEPVVAKDEPEKATAFCQQLWESLLQNPQQATVAESDWGQRQYHISSPKQGMCRYELVTEPRGSHFFDYNVQTGQVSVTTPAAKQVSSL